MGKELSTLQLSSERVLSQTKRMMEPTRRNGLRSSQSQPQATDTDLSKELDAWLENWKNVISAMKIDVKNRHELALRNLKQNRNNRSSTEQNALDASILDVFEHIVHIFTDIPEKVVCTIFGCKPKPDKGSTDPAHN